MYERMLDKSTEPTIDEMTEYCEKCGVIFSDLNNWLVECFGTQTQVAFPYGNRYGWGVGHRKGKKLVCNVFPEAGSFTVMLRLSDAQFAAVYSGVQPYTQQYIDNKYPCSDGGWIHFRVLEEEHLADIKALLTAKCGKR